MRISKTDIICGLPATTARDLMRYLEAPHRSEDLTHWIEQHGLHTTLMGLEKEGFIARHYEDESHIWWVTTVRGNALGGARFSSPITRATAERLLAAVIQRAEQYNADPSHLFEITELVVFGSYLDPAVTSLGDLDIGATVRPRPQFNPSTEQFSEMQLNYADASGRRFTAFIDRLCWASREPYVFMRNRSTAIKITKEDVRKLTDRWEVVYTNH